MKNETDEEEDVVIDQPAANHHLENSSDTSDIYANDIHT
jgi:hypothetical protein